MVPPMALPNKQVISEPLVVEDTTYNITGVFDGKSARRPSSLTTWNPPLR
jgi:hypothetical protein